MTTSAINAPRRSNTYNIPGMQEKRLYDDVIEDSAKYITCLLYTSDAADE